MERKNGNAIVFCRIAIPRLDNRYADGIETVIIMKKQNQKKKSILSAFLMKRNILMHL